MIDQIKKNKIAGAVFGFAIGDAMGATTEFMTKSEIKSKYGQVNDIIGGGWLNLKAGEVTDDTQMTMCVMDALMGKRELFKECCAGNFINWYKSGPKDVGCQCAKGIIHVMCHSSYISEDDKALGNGSLMRAMPCAILNENELNIEQGKITHNNLECSQIIQDYSRLIQDYLYGNLYTYNKDKSWDLLEPSGYIKNTFNNAVYWSNQDSFEDAIIGAVNDGGDADTIAAIVGSIAGARFGLDKIPQKWIDKLDNDVKIFLKKFINFAISYVQM